MVFRLATALAVGLLAAASVYVVRDRSSLAHTIHARQVAYPVCARGLPRIRAEQRCGWSALDDSRRGDLYGLPFLALALALTLLLLYKIRERPPDDAPRGGYVRADDPVL
jgi:hypothetical protein